MTISGEERLERLERLVESNSQAIAHLSQQQGEILGRMDRISGEVERLSGEVERLSGEVERLSGEVEKVSRDVGKLSSDVEKLSFRFETSQTIGERLERLATSLIAGATISVIAGVILLLLREGSR